MTEFTVGQKVRSTGKYPEPEILEGLVGTVTSVSKGGKYPYEVEWSFPGTDDEDPHTGRWLHNAEELKADVPEEFVIYKNASVDEMGLVQVSPDLIVKLHERLPEGYEEGNIKLRVYYDDLKQLIIATGAAVKEYDAPRTEPYTPTEEETPSA